MGPRWEWSRRLACFGRGQRADGLAHDWRKCVRPIRRRSVGADGFVRFELELLLLLLDAVRRAAPAPVCRLGLGSQPGIALERGLSSERSWQDEIRHPLVMAVVAQQRA